VKIQEAKGYEILLTSGIVYAVVNRYQESPATDHLNLLYDSIREAKKTFSSLMTEKEKINTAKGLNNFVQSYINEIYVQEEKERYSNFTSEKLSASSENATLRISLSVLEATDEGDFTAEKKLEITRLQEAIATNENKIAHLSQQMATAELRISRISQLELDLKVDVHKANLEVALSQQKKLERLIKNFNDEYQTLCASHPEMRSPCIMQDLDGLFYADLLARDLGAELNAELTKATNAQDKNEIARLKNQISTVELIKGIDAQTYEADSQAPVNNGIDKFGVKIEVLGQVINWFIIGDMDQSTQVFRDIVYMAAANAHSLTDGCTGYYRGTNSLHLKRHHTKLEDSFYNHNHYRFERDVTPEMLREHMNAIIVQEHGGNILNRDHRHIGDEAYMSLAIRKNIVDTLVGEYEEFYKNFSTERNLTSAIDMHNTDLIKQVVDLFMEYAVKTKKFDSKKSLEDFIHVTITIPLLNNGITPEMLGKYGEKLFENIAKHEYPVQGTGGNYVFSFAEYMNQYAAKAEQHPVPPKGYDHYKMLFDQTDGDGDARKFSQKDVYNHSSDRKLTLDDEQELKVAKAHEDVCKNMTHNPTRGFGSFMALFRSTQTKANFKYTPITTHASLFKENPAAVSSGTVKVIDQAESKSYRKE
jgi:DNA-binding ferritin-like protein (Dps family)